MNRSKLNLFGILFLTLIISGAFTLLFAFAYLNKDILFLGLFQLMDGSVGYYMISYITPKPPYSLKRKKD